MNSSSSADPEPAPRGTTTQSNLLSLVATAASSCRFSLVILPLAGRSRFAPAPLRTLRDSEPVVPPALRGQTGRFQFADKRDGSSPRTGGTVPVATGDGSRCHRGRFQLPPGTVPVATRDGSRCHRGRFQLPPGTVPVATRDGPWWQPPPFPYDTRVGL